MEFLANYALFFVKLFSLVIAILVVVAGVIALGSRSKGKMKGKLEVNKLNEKYKDYKQTLADALGDKKSLKAEKKKKKKLKKSKSTKEPQRLFVLNFLGDIRASAVAALTEEITALLLIAKPKDHVLIRLESGGGMVNAYGLAASQLQRIKNNNLKLTIAVDKVAASGGYMMACVADHIIAAPFAIVGSIGVLAQLPNFHRYLQKKSIDFEQISAGEFKRTLTVLGENTAKGRKKMQQEVDDVHDLFKKFIKDHRTQINTDQVATGEYWYAARAIDLKLVDELKTSDDFLLTASNEADIYEIQYRIKKSLTKRFTSSANNLLHKMFSNGLPTSGQDFIE